MELMVRFREQLNLTQIYVRRTPVNNIVSGAVDLKQYMISGVVSLGQMGELEKTTGNHTISLAHSNCTLEALRFVCKSTYLKSFIKRRRSD